MAILKCKMCGGDIQAADGAAYGTCESCGTTSTLPKASEEKTVNLFNRANHFRRLNDFDKALSAYESILNEDNTNAEAHWCAVLCRYGIEYVEDPRTHERIPTCRRAQFEPVLSDPDYLAALEYADDEYTKSLYEDEAKKIGEIQKGILAISNKEEPYDVFICYKETTDGGSRTKDSTIAQDIYYELTKDGYKVFFAKITLEDKLGQEYEPYIFSALNSAKVMLVIGTRKEYFEAVWVKNEWSRFLAIMKKDRSRLLIPCYRDMDAYDIPDELSNLQSQDMSKVGFIQDILRGVKKVLDAGKAVEKTPSATAETAAPVVIPKRFANVTLEKEKTNLVKKINDLEKSKIDSELFLNRAQDELNRAQDELRHYQEEERQWAIDQQRKKREAEFTASLNRDGRQGLYDQVTSLWANFFQYSNPHTKFVENAQEQVNKAREGISSLKNSMAANDRSLVTYRQELNDLDYVLRKTEVQRTEEYYQSLLEKKRASTEINKLTELGDQFKEMEGYKDTKALSDECYNLALKKTYDSLVKVKNEMDSSERATADDYKTFARSFREWKGYADSEELARDCDNRALEAQYKSLVQAKSRASTENEYQDLARKFREMNGYKDTAELATEYEELLYDRLVQAKNKASTENEYQDLARKFREMNGYKDTAELATEYKELFLKAQYDRLVQAKNRASTDEFPDLARQFRDMDGYKDTEALASECDNQYRVCIERREEQERIDREHRAEQEKKDKQEQERREVEKRQEEERQRIEEEKKIMEKRARRKRNVILSTACLVIVAVGIVSLAIRQKNREFTTISSQMAYVHEGPSTDNETPIDEIHQNTKVEVLERYDDSSWVKISYGDGKTGYVNSEHLWRAAGLYVGEAYQGNRDLLGSVKWIRRNVKTDTNYTIVLGKDETVKPISLSFYNVQISITLETAGAVERSVRYSDAQPSSSLFTVGQGVTFTLEEGVNLVGQRNGRLVDVNEGTFTMNGGSIKNGWARRGGGVHIRGGTFTMNNGTITGNSATDSGGGIYINRGSTFTMNDGIISGNKAEYGGGVSVSTNGTFIKSAGIIYGSNASDDLANRASSNNNGHAVVLAYSNSNVSRVRNSTAGANQTIDSRLRSGAAGGWQ